MSAPVLDEEQEISPERRRPEDVVDGRSSPSAAVDVFGGDESLLENLFSNSSRDRPDFAAMVD